MDEIRDRVSDAESVVLALSLARMTVLEMMVRLHMRRVEHFERVDKVVLGVREATTGRDHKEAVEVENDVLAEAVDKLRRFVVIH